ncbi:MAG TPA: heavy-metal-associated domain-containing protein [Bacteroidota bacterium]
MKTTLILLTILVALVVFGCAKTEEQPTVQTASIKVETAVCGDCGSTITDALKKVEGVQEASVDNEKKTATVQFLPAKVDLKRLETAIADAGYNANDTKRNPEAYEKLEECCKVDSKESHH